jgi:hypothetical protein
MPDIHYTDALLTVLFGGGIGFMLWSVKQFNRIEMQIIRTEKKMRKALIKANMKGAKSIADSMRDLVTALKVSAPQ